MPCKYAYFHVFMSKNLKTFNTLKITWAYKSNKQHPADWKKTRLEGLRTPFFCSCLTLMRLFMDVVNIVQGSSLQDFRLKIYLVCTHFFCDEKMPHIFLHYTVTISFKN